MTIYYKDRAFYDADTLDQAPRARAPLRPNNTLGCSPPSIPAASCPTI
ncbi:TPA: hypothetical protein ACJL9K_001279 [Neisseria meningitidis]